MNRWKNSFYCLAGVLLAAVLSVIPANAEGNPYNGGWSNCTWSAWQLVYDDNGIEMPALGNAGNWFDNAQANGISVGYDPVPGSVGVWSGGLGHVAYVSAVDSDSIYVKEGGFAGNYHEGWITDFSTRYGKILLGYIYPGKKADTADRSQDIGTTELIDGLEIPLSILPEDETTFRDDFGFSVFESLPAEKNLFSETEIPLLKAHDTYK